LALRIVTDSTSDLTPELQSEYGIGVIPLTVHFGPESFKDQIEMTADGFWAKLGNTPHHPKTAQPSPGEFMELYQKVHAEGDEILSIHLSSALSGTLSSASIAAQMMPDAKITLVDTKSVSLGLGMLVIEAARMAKAGKTVEEIAGWANQVKERMTIYFTLDTLEFLRKNGRMGRAQALLGGLLGIKPILTVDRDGLVAPADKVRGRAKVFPRILELMQEQTPAGRTIRCATLHARAHDEAARLLEEIKQLYKVEESWIAEIGPVVATNGGPGTVGVAFYEV
jgi:DegV family protein with EDD domain